MSLSVLTIYIFTFDIVHVVLREYDSKNPYSRVCFLKENINVFVLCSQVHLIMASWTL